MSRALDHSIAVSTFTGWPGPILPFCAIRVSSCSLNGPSTVPLTLQYHFTMGDLSIKPALQRKRGQDLSPFSLQSQSSLQFAPATLQHLDLPLHVGHLLALPPPALR